MKTTTVLGYTHRFYDALLANASDNTFVGKLTQVYNSLELPSAAYSHVRALLTSPGDNGPCVEVIQRGNKRVPSIVVLHHPPPDHPPEDFTMEPLTTRAEVTTLRERVQALEKRLDEYAGFNVKKVLRNIESRLTKLEAPNSSG
jgi:hypothetical protein